MRLQNYYKLKVRAVLTPLGYCMCMPSIWLYTVHFAFNSATSSNLKMFSLFTGNRENMGLIKDR